MQESGTPRNKKKIESRPTEVRKIIYTSSFTAGYNKLLKDNKLALAKAVDRTVDKLSKFQITKQQNNHPLEGKMKGWWDVHVVGNLVIIYKYERDNLYIDLRLGDLTDHDYGLSKKRKIQ